MPGKGEVTRPAGHLLPEIWARVSKESRVRHGQPLELAVDTRYLQFFDPASGLPIGHPLATAGLAEA